MEQNKLLFSEGTGKSKNYFIKSRNLKIQNLAFFRCAIFFSILLGSFFVFGVGKASAATYYVDNTCTNTGNGSCNGTAPDCACSTANNYSSDGPFNSLTDIKASGKAYSPGDKILLKRGQVYGGPNSTTVRPSLLYSNDGIYLTYSGDAENPIIIDAYGTGEAPVIDMRRGYPNSLWTADVNPANGQTDYKLNNKYYYSPSGTFKGVFEDNAPLARANTRAGMYPGTFWWDSVNYNIYVRPFSGDLTGKTIWIPYQTLPYAPINLTSSNHVVVRNIEGSFGAQGGLFVTGGAGVIQDDIIAQNLVLHDNYFGMYTNGSGTKVITADNVTLSRNQMSAVYADSSGATINVRNSILGPQFFSTPAFPQAGSTINLTNSISIGTPQGRNVVKDPSSLGGTVNFVNTPIFKNPQFLNAGGMGLGAVAFVTDDYIANTGWHSDVADIFATHEAKHTWFITSLLAPTQWEEVDYALSKNQKIGFHTRNHPQMSTTAISSKYGEHQKALWIQDAGTCGTGCFASFDGRYLSATRNGIQQFNLDTQDSSDACNGGGPFDLTYLGDNTHGLIACIRSYPFFTAGYPSIEPTYKGSFASGPYYISSTIIDTQTNINIASSSCLTTIGCMRINNENLFATEIMADDKTGGMLSDWSAQTSYPRIQALAENPPTILSWPYDNYSLQGIARLWAKGIKFGLSSDQYVSSSPSAIEKSLAMSYMPGAHPINPTFSSSLNFVMNTAVDGVEEAENISAWTEAYPALWAFFTHSDHDGSGTTAGKYSGQPIWETTDAQAAIFSDPQIAPFTSVDSGDWTVNTISMPVCSAKQPKCHVNAGIMIRNQSGSPLNMHEGTTTFTISGTYLGVPVSENITFTCNAEHKVIADQRYRIKYGTQYFDTISDVTVDHVPDDGLLIGLAAGRWAGSGILKPAFDAFLDRNLELGGTVTDVETFNTRNEADGAEFITNAEMQKSGTSACSITGATQTNPVVVTCSSTPPFVNGDNVVLSDVVGMTQLNGNIYKVGGLAGNNFNLLDTAGTNIDGTYYDAYDSTGTVKIAGPYRYTRKINLTQPDLSIKSTSPAIDAGIVVSGITTDSLGNPIYGPPDIGGYEFQPSFEIGTDGIDTTSGARIYGDGKFRDYEGEGEGTTADLSVTPESGTFTTYGDDEVRPLWMDITDLTWGSDYKEWKESSDTLGETNTLHTIGSLTAGNTYTLAIDGNSPAGFITGSTECTEEGSCIANQSGQITFTYTGGYSEHIFGLTGEDEEDNDEISNENNERDLNTSKIKAVSTQDSIAIKWKTDYKTRSTIRYGTDRNLKEKKKDNDKEKKHKMTLNNLLPDTKYYFRIKSEDGDDNEDKSKIHFIKTKPSNENQSSAANRNQTNTANQAAQETPASSSSFQNTNPTLCSYTVESGDTLWNIARKVYGDPTNYPLIVEKNKDKYPDIASKLSIGQELTFCENTSEKSSDNSAESRSNNTNEVATPSSDEPQTQDSGFKWWNPFSWF